MTAPCVAAYTARLLTATVPNTARRQRGCGWRRRAAPCAREADTLSLAPASPRADKLHLVLLPAPRAVERVGRVHTAAPRAGKSAIVPPLLPRRTCEHVGHATVPREGECVAALPPHWECAGALSRCHHRHAGLPGRLALSCERAASHTEEEDALS